MVIFFVFALNVGIPAVPAFRRNGRRCIDSSLIFMYERHTYPEKRASGTNRVGEKLAHDGNFLTRNPLPGTNHSEKIISVWITV